MIVEIDGIGLVDVAEADLPQLKAILKKKNKQESEHKAQEFARQDRILKALESIPDTISHGIQKGFENAPEHTYEISQPELPVPTYEINVPPPQYTYNAPEIPLAKELHLGKVVRDENGRMDEKTVIRIKY